MLDWYDRHARVLPWRAARDPYRIWLSEVMLQQTTVAAIKDYYLRFTTRWPDVAALAAAADGDVMAEWAGLGYYARARNLLACARAVAARGGFPTTEAELRELPGIGPYTAAAVAAIAFDRRAVVVDGNVERVMARFFAVETPLPQAKGELRNLADLVTPQGRPGDYAQAVMDLGATICTPRNPSCGICPLMQMCQGRGMDLPRKLPKPTKPTRQGKVWIVTRPDGLTLLERRAARGLLGGMLAFPSDAWDGVAGDPPVRADWQDHGTVQHVFTHFRLTLRVFSAQTSANPNRGAFQPLNPDDLPTLMRKAFDAAQKSVP